MKLLAQPHGVEAGLIAEVELDRFVHRDLQQPTVLGAGTPGGPLTGMLRRAALRGNRSPARRGGGW